MALRAGYYGVKKRFMDEINKLDGILPAGVSKTNKLVAQSEIDINIISPDIKAVEGLTAYEVSFIRGYKVGNIANIILTVKSLTENANPSGRSYIDVLEGIPSPITDYNEVVASGSGGNSLQYFISGSGTPKIQMRGGTTNATYYINLLYVCDVPENRSLSKESPEEIVKDEIEEPVVEKKTTKKKSTAKAETTEEV